MEFNIQQLNTLLFHIKDQTIESKLNNSRHTKTNMQVKCNSNEYIITYNNYKHCTM